MIVPNEGWPPGATWRREIPFLANQWSEPDEDGIRRLVVDGAEHGIDFAPDRMMPVCQIRGRCRTGELARTWGSVGTTVSGNPGEGTLILECEDAYEGVLIVWGN